MTWKEKTPGPILRRSRIWHFALGLAGVAGLGAWRGPGAACGAMLLVCALGYGWEQSNAAFRMGAHPFASPWDFAAFVIGGVAGLLGVLACKA